MLIKEYHIPLPLTLEEYRIAQLYMIQKKSREESEGEESGVEIIENKPYTEGPFNGGQYTYKVYYIGRHIPGWLRGMVPKTALEVHEESWNAYPFTKTKFSVPFVEKFTLEIDTVFYQDGGTQENVFNLSRSELRNRKVDTIDIVNDTLSGSDYKEQEDPSLFVSSKTGRGPLKEDWIANPPNNTIMCSYKLIKVEFRYWGLQSRIEHFIHDYALRRVMLRAHRQAWAWQDEWVGLTMDDIRKLETETKLILQKKLGRSLEEGEGEEEEESEVKEEGIPREESQISFRSNNSSRRYSRQVTGSSEATPITGPHPPLDETNYCPLDNIAIHEESDSEEYYDAKEVISEEEEEEGEEFDQEYYDPLSFSISSSEQFYDSSEPTDDEQDDHAHCYHAPSGHPNHDVLLLVVSGGASVSPQCTTDKEIDLKTLQDTFKEVYNTHYQNSLNSYILKYVHCPNLTSQIYESLSAILPSSFHQTTPIFPFTALPIFITEHPNYSSQLNLLIKDINKVYYEFIRSREGINFNGKVCLITDCIASLMIYDILTRPLDHTHIPTPNEVCLQNLSVKNNDLLRSFSAPVENVERENMNNYSHDHQFSSLSSSPLSYDSRQLKISQSLEDRSLKLSFHVFNVFSFGSPLGLVLSMRKHKGYSPIKPDCHSYYNLFYSVDPLAFRLEPLLFSSFTSIDPLFVPCYLHYPTGDTSSVNLQDTINNWPHLLSIDALPLRAPPTSSLESSQEEEVKSKLPSHQNNNLFEVWWGLDRIDYQLEAPVNVERFYSPSYHHIVQARYWEAKEMASFVLRQVLHCRNRLSVIPRESIHTSLSFANGREVGDLGVPFVPPTSIVKWAKRKTPLRIQKMSPNHRAVDLVIASSHTQEPVLHAKFFYGPLNMATLSGEMVNIYMLKPKQAPLTDKDHHQSSINLREGFTQRDWAFIDSTATDKHGRLVYSLTDEQCPSLPGVYPMIFLVKGDHTLARSNLFLLPPYIEAVVFSIDGALCSNFTISGRDMKLKGGALETTRMWQDQGYLPIYITGRPIIQKEYIMSWLALHGFPLGVVSFSDTLSADSQNIKLLYLARLIKEARVILCGAYGSHRHLTIYKELGLQSDQIYLHVKNSSSKKNGGLSTTSVGITSDSGSSKRKSSNKEYQLLSGDFWRHLETFKPRPAVINVNELIGKLNFGYTESHISPSL